jgi:hypothetical protein
MAGGVGDVQMRRRQIYAEQTYSLGTIGKSHWEELLKAPPMIPSLGLSPFAHDDETNPIKETFDKPKTCPKCGKALGRGGHFHVKACRG